MQCQRQAKLISLTYWVNLHAIFKGVIRKAKPIRVDIGTIFQEELHKGLVAAFTRGGNEIAQNHFSTLGSKASHIL
jgi:hypothetical protein